ncbi:Aminopeptidase M1 [Zostera marina]|uniref:Aminopeptidase n=1 Tax=Zostera marina TaxID=29655 RepID=A0A0K9NXR6_ZOSMR|nr:Aminopeptidase M1 [Zostera marina]
MVSEQFKGQARLPGFAIPKRYDLTLQPDLIHCTFSGSVEITVDVVAETRSIVLNAADLTFDGDGPVSFRISNSSQELRPSELVHIPEDEILVLGFDDYLPLGVGVLAIRFYGTLNDQMKGFYRSSYDLNGEKKNMAVTQFEPADARRCFPCWDEPAFKATFKITLVVPSELVALSCMPVTEEKINGPLKTVFYKESPIMSTYLVAVVVGMFDYVEGISPDGTKVRVYTQVGKSDQGKFALACENFKSDLVCKICKKNLCLLIFHFDSHHLEILNFNPLITFQYFDTPYALPKLDMIAIPDFAAGAMENYGLVTYRDTALLYDEHHSAAANKQRVANVVAHELAHQWFGNLVTMEWWTHLWLNEGFATWVSYLANDSMFPEWNVWTQFLDQCTQGLRLDALAESHPIEVDINHASEIDEIFDAISYRKGASVIQMLQSYLGAECFQKALACYIKRFACSNARTEDLWHVLEEESGEPVKMIMSSWTKQMGYPVIGIKLAGHELQFNQTQFLSNGSSGDGQWIVPVTLSCGSYDAQRNFLLKSKVDRMDLTDLIKSKNDNGESFWIKVNVNQTGFYRVKYDDNLLARLGKAIEANMLSPTDRFGVLEDSFSLCMACKKSLSSLLSLMNSYRQESDYTVLSHIITVAYKVLKITADATPELSNDIKKFFIILLKSAAEKLGWDPKNEESHLDSMLRGEILTALAFFGHEATLKEAQRRFNAFLADRNSSLLPPDTRKAAYVAVMQTDNSSNSSGFDSLLRVYRETDLSQEKGRILGSLASCPDPDIVLKALNFSLCSEVRTQDAIFCLAGVGRQGRETAWKWLKDNWEFISNTWKSGYLLGRFVGAVVSPFCSEEKVIEVDEFFSTHSKTSFVRVLKQSLEVVKINSSWVLSIKNENTLGGIVNELAHK